MSKLIPVHIPHRLHKWLIRLLCASGVGIALFLLVDQILYPLPEELLVRPHATFIYSREGRLLTAFTSSDRFWRKPVTLDRISPKLIESVLATEDRYFYLHPGVNPFSLIEAVAANVKAGHTVRGGSTITMQIARMIEPKARTIPNKLKEIFRAVQLELRFSKSELLEMYFNLAPYGGNVEGVGAAAFLYFHKAPSELTWSEAALLTAIPGSPEKFRPDKCLSCGVKRAHVILDRLAQADVLTDEEKDAALVEQIPSNRIGIPRTAPHLAAELHAANPDSSELHTTISWATQEQCERLAQAYHTLYESKGIHNLAIVAIDNRTSEIVAQVGSPDFGDTRHSGQVNAAQAPRSPGSALKPFLYGLAFDQGLLSPAMMVADIPVNFSGYRPVNYDEQYRGLVSVHDALSHSLNVPAVDIAANVDLKQFYDILRRGGLSTLDRPYYDYGLPLVLGACEVRLTDLTNLYASLARGGYYEPIRTLTGSPVEPGARLYSPEASYLLTDILVDVQRPDLPDAWQSSEGGFPVAWKTGTSYGRRDAWAIGYTPDFTVGVWSGNCSGEGSVDLVGAVISAPVLFHVLREILPEKSKKRFDVPPGIGERKVCSVSGQPVGQFCKETKMETFYTGTSPAATCTVHRPVLVDKQSHMRIMASCTEGRDYERQVVEIWPPRLQTWLVDHGLQSPLPPLDPDCLQAPLAGRPGIISPEDGAVFELVDEIPADYQKIRLQATLASGAGTLHWFLDGKHLAAVTSGDVVFYTPTKGKHRLLCVDEAGGSTSSSFVVD